MARFDDYHRTIVGYHGTRLSVALRMVNRIEGFRWSRRGYDWLGHGIYFWEYAPDQALEFARIRQQQAKRKKNPTLIEARRAKEPLAVVASMIRLGFCFDLLDPFNVEYVQDVFEQYRQDMALGGIPLPKNRHRYRKLDCDVFEYAYAVLEKDGSTVDTARGVYVPTGGKERVWEGSWISKDTHIQICVRNAASILGTWLHYPDKLEIDDVRQNLGDLGDTEEGVAGEEESEEADAGGTT